MKISFFNNKNSVFYVETEYQPKLNRFIRNNYTELVNLFNSSNLNFYYLPVLLEDKGYWNIIHYNRPYVQPVSVIAETQQIYDFLIKRNRSEVRNGALLLSSGDEFSRIPFPTFLLNDQDATLISFRNMSERISSYFGRFIHPQVMYGELEPKVKRLTDFRTESMYVESAQDLFTYDEIETEEAADADSKFEIEAFQLADEIRERIELLKEYGALSLIGNIIEEIQETKNKLSSLFITDDFRIFLKDYGMKEVVMSPLPKSLFLLFLNHPEGILFKELGNYHDELLSIYRNITLRENIDAVMESIKAMTDPLNNSVNEKCSRIRSAFLEVINDDLAKNYYITGRRGEPKKITLNRKLVKYQLDSK